MSDLLKSPWQISSLPTQWKHFWAQDYETVRDSCSHEGASQSWGTRTILVESAARPSKQPRVVCKHKFLRRWNALLICGFYFSSVHSHYPVRWTILSICSPSMFPTVSTCSCDSFLMNYRFFYYYFDFLFSRQMCSISFLLPYIILLWNLPAGRSVWCKGRDGWFCTEIMFLQLSEVKTSCVKPELCGKLTSSDAFI